MNRKVVTSSHVYFQSLDWFVTESVYGRLLVALSPVGIVRIRPIGANESTATVKEILREDYPSVKLNEIQPVEIFNSDGSENVSAKNIPLHLIGSVFQVEVWKSLLEILPGNFATYGQIAQAVGRPHAYRAVGNAVGRNPIAILIPCHRIVPSHPAPAQPFGNYHYGSKLKERILAIESRLMSKRINNCL